MLHEGGCDDKVKVKAMSHTELMHCKNLWELQEELRVRVSVSVPCCECECALL